MKTTVAKKFRFESAHRLPWHDGQCKNLHGDSYRMTGALEGEPDERGFLVDFQVIKRVVKPLVEALDHSVLIAQNDELLLTLIQSTDWRYVMLPYDSTSENLCRYVAETLRDQAADTLRAHRVSAIHITLSETDSSYAQLTLSL